MASMADEPRTLSSLADNERHLVEELIVASVSSVSIADLLTLKQVSKDWRKHGREAMRLRRERARVKLSSLHQVGVHFRGPLSRRQSEIERLTANWLHRERGGGWSAEYVASWLYSDKDVAWDPAWAAEDVAEWLRSKQFWPASREGAGWDVVRLARWLRSKEGAGWPAVAVAKWLFQTLPHPDFSEAGADSKEEQVADWLCSEEALARDAAEWLHSEEGAAWEAEVVAKRLMDAKYETEQVARWLRSTEGAGWPAKDVAYWLFGRSSEAGADWKAVRVAKWLCSEEVDAKDVAEWLLSEEGADWKDEQVADWLRSAGWEAVRVANWLYSFVGANWEHGEEVARCLCLAHEWRDVAEWLNSKEGAKWEAEDVAGWLFREGYPIEQVASWLHIEEGGGREAVRVAEWLLGLDWDYRCNQPSTVPAWGADDVAEWLCSNRGAGWAAEDVAKWLRSADATTTAGMNWDSKDVQSWLKSQVDRQSRQQAKSSVGGVVAKEAAKGKVQPEPEPEPEPELEESSDDEESEGAGQLRFANDEDIGKPKAEECDDLPEDWASQDLWMDMLDEE